METVNTEGLFLTTYLIGFALAFIVSTLFGERGYETLDRSITLGMLWPLVLLFVVSVCLGVLMIQPFRLLEMFIAFIIDLCHT